MHRRLARTLTLAVALVGSAFGHARAAEFDPWSQTARYAFEYHADLTPLAAARARSVRVWIPVPSDTASQKVLSLEIEAPWPHRLTRDRLGNRIVYLERGRAAAAGGEAIVRVTVQRSPYGGVPAAAATTGSALDADLYRKPARRIPLDGLIRQISSQQSRGLTSPAQKIRAFYDYVVKTMQYSKQGDGWGHGDAIWACTSKTGNCTDFHSLFIGLARAQSIPARFVIGFPIPEQLRQGKIDGYHCWAEVFDPDRGWIPLDASEAKKSGRVEDYFGRLPSDRIEFSVGRDLVLEPPQEGEPVNYFVYPYAEVDGRPANPLPKHFHFQRLPSTTARR